MAKKPTSKSPKSRKRAKAKRATKPVDAPNERIPFRLVGGVPSLPADASGLYDPIREAAIETACKEIRNLHTEDIIALLPVLGKFATRLRMPPSGGGGA